MVGLRSRPMLAAVALCAPAFALASSPSGGGGGGGSTPGMTSSKYDAATEYKKAIQAIQDQKFAEARKAIEHVLAVAPDDANSNYIAGVASAGMGDDKGAKRFYEHAVRADRDLIQAHRELGLTYLKLGDKAKAQAELDRLTQMQQKCAAACAKAADIGTAIETLTKAMTGAPQARADGSPSLLFAGAGAGDGAYLEAVSLINAHRYEEALAALATARGAFGPHPDILTYQGFANRKLGRYDVAERYYREALAAAPHHRAATEYYGELKVERGDTAGARTLLADLDTTCTFGCAEADELRRWIDAGHAPAR
jgi:tetratricopeptide (TPR) repeat protein